MIRIISGKYKGKRLEGFDTEGTRPTQDRIKESMFSMIQEDILESIVLDLFAGTANLGLEALSNGAKRAYFVDINKEAIKKIKKNLDKVPTSDYRILEMDYKSALEKFKEENIKFSLVFLDPPYKDDTISFILNYLVDNNMLMEDSTVVCELEHDNLEETYKTLELYKAKKYGYKIVKIYRN